MIRFAAVLCELRPLAPRDKATLRRFFRSHDPDTLRQRYGGAIAELTSQILDRLTNGPDHSTYAFGIFRRAGRPPELHAVGRLCFDETGESAEVAFVVGENQRNQGMATILLRTLILEAVHRGIKRLTAEVDPQNRAMLHVLEKQGFMRGPDRKVSGISLILRLHTSTSIP